MPTAKVLLEARALHVQRGRQAILHDIHLSLQPGERLGLLGLNGAGKSTLLHTLAGIHPPTRGMVRLQGQDIYRHASARTRIALLPDEPALPLDMTLRDWLLFCARMLGLRGDAARQAVETQLARFDLAGLRHCLPRQLSRGQQQRLSLARALLQPPAVLLLDEPTNGLDPLQAEAIRHDLQTRTGDTGMILASHLREDLALCQRVLLLADGRIQCELPTEALENTPLREHLEASPC